MAKSQATFMKKQREKDRQKKKENKAVRKQERREYATGGGLDHMMAYVNEFGELTSVQPQGSVKNSETA
ncbi:hypothetical protein [Mucilaginibacter sp.]|uniref:hypothetical protein n=1 Tax=Mucilaginibacter sp. TaxID=1882438 RepID=UPI003564A3B5